MLPCWDVWVKMKQLDLSHSVRRKKTRRNHLPTMTKDPTQCLSVWRHLCSDHRQMDSRISTGPRMGLSNRLHVSCVLIPVIANPPPPSHAPFNTNDLTWDHFPTWSLTTPGPYSWWIPPRDWLLSNGSRKYMPTSRHCQRHDSAFLQKWPLV